MKVFSPACLLSIVALCGAGCIMVRNAAGPDARQGSSHEELAAREALSRFARMLKAESLPVDAAAPLGNALPKVEGCKFERISREDLISRYKGERLAPRIVAITISRQGDDPESVITILVALETAAMDGFEAYPDGVGREYVFRPSSKGFEFVKEQGWVE